MTIPEAIRAFCAREFPPHRRDAAYKDILAAFTIGWKEKQHIGFYANAKRDIDRMRARKK